MNENAFFLVRVSVRCSFLIIIMCFLRFSPFIHKCRFSSQVALSSSYMSSTMIFTSSRGFARVSRHIELSRMQNLIVQERINFFMT